MAEEKTETIIEVETSILISDFNDITYSKLLNDYKKHFHNRRVAITTNYKKLSSFNVHFRMNDLPHLMGWDKITDKNISAKKILNWIEKGTFTIDSSRSHARFPEARKRMMQYAFIHDIFTYGNAGACLITRNMKPNSMKLDIVFYKENKDEAVILGLRKDLKMDYFVLTTLHTATLPNQFSLRRRTNITSIKWEDEITI